jgi:uncharacterized protein (TIGR03437 family)
VIRGTRVKPLPLLPSGPGGVRSRPLHEARSLTNNYSINMRQRGLTDALLCVVAMIAIAPLLTPRRKVVAQAALIPPGLQKIEHFVFIMQENRSFDHYFGTYPGAEGIPPGVCLPAVLPGVSCVAPYHNPSLTNLGGAHFNQNAIADIDGGMMDGFVGQGGGAQGDVMGWHDSREIPNYWSYAGLYVLQDRLFESVLSYSLPAHLYMLAAQSGGYVGFVPIPQSYSFPEITELLQSGRIDWRYYVNRGPTPGAGDGEAGETVEADETTYSFWNPLPAFPLVANDPNQFGRLTNAAQFFTDARNGTLPQVSWVIPNYQQSEHPSATVNDGMNYVTTLINAVMQGPEWPTTAIFVAWDDWGGFYDHVMPPSLDQFSLGIRVPGLVISPYSRQGYVDHKTYSFESWLRLIEERFGVNALNSRDNNANDMIDAFDFTQAPRPPVILDPNGSPYPPPPQSIATMAGTLAAVNSAYATYSLAPDAFGSAYVSQPVSAGSTLTVTDSMGVARNTQVYAIAGNVMNFIVPDGTATGVATLSAAGSTGTALIGNIAPGLFTANQTGQGPAAAEVYYTHPDGSSTVGFTFQCDASGNCANLPISFGTDSLLLVLYGTGIRGASSMSNVTVNIANLNLPVSFAGAQPTIAGLDQVNVALPASLKGRGQVVLTVTVDGQASNMVQLAFQ